MTWTAPLQGLHSLTAVAVDQINATAGSPLVPVTIAPAGPTLGILGAPIASPPGGVYPAGQLVSLAAAPGATIHYTVDGSMPDLASPSYSGPIALTQAMVIRARASQSGWTESAPSSDSYGIDTAGPTIVPTISPGPNAAGWNNTAVTVSFECSDPAGVASCPTPVTVTQEGAGLLVAVNAQDALGFQSTLTVTVNIDSTAPSVSLTSPTADLSTIDVALALAGSASDTGSGVARAMCGTQVATLSGAAATCSVPLVPGQNSVVLAVVDAAGNSASAGIRVTRTTAPTALVIAPTTVALAVGDARGLTVTSEAALPVTGVAWTSSDTSVVTIDPANDGTIVAAALGQATVTASLGGLTATATVRVLPGAVMPGESIWTSAPTPGRYLQAPLRANPVRDEDPDLFSVEVDPLSSGMLVRAVRGADGATLWSETVDERPQAADAFGGLLVRSAAVIPSLPNATMLQRLGGGGIAPWTYVSSGSIGSAAAGPDGTVYLTEYLFSPSSAVPTNSNPNPVRVDTFIVGLDGLNGAVRFRRGLPNGTARWGQQTWEGACVSPLYVDGGYLGPIAILENGDAAVQQSIQHFTHAGCPNAWVGSGPFYRQVSLSVWRVTSTGATTSTTLRDHSGNWPIAGERPGDEDYLLGVNRPDGHGGVLSTWQLATTDGQHGQVSRVAGGAVAFTQPAPWAQYYDDRERPDVMITSNGTAYLPDGPNGEMRARSTDTWTPHWTAPTSGMPIQGLYSGGLQWITFNANSVVVQELDSSGVLIRSTDVGISSPTAVLRDQGVLHGIDTSGSLAMVAGFVSTAIEWSYSTHMDKCTQGILLADVIGNDQQLNIGLEPRPTPYTYDFLDLAPGQPGHWETSQMSGVNDAFGAWNSVLLNEDLDISFRHLSVSEKNAGVSPDILIRKGGLTPPQAGGFFGNEPRLPNLRVNGGVVFMSAFDTVLLEHIGFFKTTLHEIGHSLGLAHPTATVALPQGDPNNLKVLRRGGTVMNPNGSAGQTAPVQKRRDDFLGFVPVAPTACDIKAVRYALLR